MRRWPCAHRSTVNASCASRGRPGRTQSPRRRSTGSGWRRSSTARPPGSSGNEARPPLSADGARRAWKAVPAPAGRGSYGHRTAASGRAPPTASRSAAGRSGTSRTSGSSGRRGSPAGYARLLDASAAAIRGGDPGARWSSPGSPRSAQHEDRGSYAKIAAVRRRADFDLVACTLRDEHAQMVYQLTTCRGDASRLARRKPLVVTERRRVGGGFSRRPSSGRS